MGLGNGNKLESKYLETKSIWAFHVLCQNSKIFFA